METPIGLFRPGFSLHYRDTFTGQRHLSSSFFAAKELAVLLHHRYAVPHFRGLAVTPNRIPNQPALWKLQQPSVSTLAEAIARI